MVAQGRRRSDNYCSHSMAGGSFIAGRERDGVPVSLIVQTVYRICNSCICAVVTVATLKQPELRHWGS